MDASQFLSGVLAIIVIDIVLAGDNAIVIALATRGLDGPLRKRAIVWGTAGAVAVRSAMTVIVVWLLAIPGLMLAGGLMLLWIAYRLLVPDEAEGHGGEAPATSFWAAMRTIVVADAVMGLDNVLAVAGAAHGSWLLVVIGLAISVPIVVWGSTLVLRLIDRHPGIVYIGAGVLLWTAATMITGERVLGPTFAEAPALAWAVYATIPAVLWAGFAANHRRFDSRIRAHLEAFSSQLPPKSGDAEPAGPADAAEGARPMLKVLIPVDGSPNALGAVRHVVREYHRNHELELHLLNVQPRMRSHVAQYVTRADREAWRAERAREALASAEALLTAEGVPYVAHDALGDRAACICDAAVRLGVDHIVMGAARRGSITRMIEDSTTDKVLSATPVPVEIVLGPAVSRWERWGVVASLLAAAGAVGLAAAD